MAPNIISKLLNKDKDKPPRYPISRMGPKAVGIDNSTCEINPKHTKWWKLPIPPPEQRDRKLGGTRPRNPQYQSLFFAKVPREVRYLIYKEVMGGRRVHVDYGFRTPSIHLQRREMKKDPPRWLWWHCVCEMSDCYSFVDDRYYDHCPGTIDKAFFVRREGESPPQRRKIGDVEWLRCCQMGYEEAIPVLYGTNVFVTGFAMDTVFRISRLLRPDYTSLITAMDIAFTMQLPTSSADSETELLPGDWATVYPAFFELFTHSFRNVRRLRLTMCLDQSHVAANVSTRALLAPLESLTASREWDQLDLCVPISLYLRLKERAEEQDRWVLRVSECGRDFPVPCF